MGLFFARLDLHFDVMRNARFHGRFESGDRPCEAPGCVDPGEFRAPGAKGASPDGPGDYRWFCLDHVREFNSGYNWFEGMSTEEILAAQSPAAGWQTESRVFRADASAYSTPKWADFDDPLDAIGARAAGIRRNAAGATPAASARFSAREHEALGVMGLADTVDRGDLRRRYAQLVRDFHPDRNGGDRRHEARLQKVVEAYQVLRKAAAFA